ncbi:MAG: hypothetical protein Ct9H300mP1_23990 [Planctomycetaceae bacterium]|nr:MAG: hypothetical protein Ct9H300mP1_23990 [Planctomycetaceae bacterium]
MLDQDTPPKQLGQMSEARWKTLLDQLVEVEAIPNPEQ